MSPLIQSEPSNPAELAWLVDVSEILFPINESNPIYVRRGWVEKGPPRPRPEWHPYCEISIRIAGAGYTLVESERAHVRPGDVFMLGPGIPHWGTIESYPLSTITAYFLPWVSVEMGPERDGMRVLRRFTARQSLADRLLRPSPALLAQIRPQFEGLVAEYESRQLGNEFRLRSRLMELIVTIIQWEQTRGRNIGGGELEDDWRPITRALQYLRGHYNEPVYAKDLARVAGLSVTLLNQLFQNAVGISWVKFLQGYRIHRAAALLSTPGHNVSEVALAVGFESFAHFSTMFSRLMGVSPKDFQHGKTPAQRRNR